MHYAESSVGVARKCIFARVAAKTVEGNIRGIGADCGVKVNCYFDVLGEPRPWDFRHEIALAAVAPNIDQ